MTTLLQDLRYGIRMLMKNPGYTVVAIIALALGIGANTAIFSIVNAVLLRPLPYLDSERLVVVESGNRQAGTSKFGGGAPADFWDWQAQSVAFEQLAAISGGGFNLTGVDNPEALPASRVSTNFFEMLKARPLLGRAFAPEDGSIKTPDKIILSHRLWQRRFGGAPDIVGKTLGDTGTEVVGVMPPDFKFPSDAEVWIPLARDSGEMKNRANRYFSVVGLIKPDQTITGAQAELQTVASRLEAEYPATNKDITVQLVPFRDRLVRDVKSSLLILLGAVTLVLLIACANVASLLLARAAARRKEMAIRLAMGAGRWRLIRQLLTESLLLGLMGGVAGLLLALWGMDLLVKLLPETYAYLQLQEHVRIDGAVLVFTLLLAVSTGVLFGLAPAWQATRSGLNDWLKDGSRSSDGRQMQRVRGAFVVAEIALALILLVGAGLLIQSFVRLQQSDLGFDPRNLFAMGLSVSLAKYPDDAARVRFVRQMLEQVSTTPGVAAVTVSSGQTFPFLNFNFNIEGRPLPVEANALYETISPNYFRALKAQMLAGREFDERDRTNSPGVAIINETLARQYFANDNALGKRITINYLTTRQTREIVGIVRDINQGAAGKITPQVYVSYEQQPWLSTALIVRAATNPESVRRDVQRAIWAVDKTQPVAKSDPAEQALAKALAEPRLYTALLGLFAALALILAAVGIYGVMSYTVTHRTREIGVRMALGAGRRDIFKLIVGQGLQLALIGIAVGCVAAFALTRVMASLLFGMSATDPVTFGAIALLLTGVALVACYLPARRATKVDPMNALRYE